MCSCRKRKRINPVTSSVDSESGGSYYMVESNSPNVVVGAKEPVEIVVANKGVVVIAAGQTTTLPEDQVDSLIAQGVPLWKIF